MRTNYIISIIVIFRTIFFSSWSSKYTSWVWCRLRTCIRRVRNNQILSSVPVGTGRTLITLKGGTLITSVFTKTRSGTLITLKGGTLITSVSMKREIELSSPRSLLRCEAVHSSKTRNGKYERNRFSSFFHRVAGQYGQDRLLDALDIRLTSFKFRPDGFFNGGK